MCRIEKKKETEINIYELNNGMLFPIFPSGFHWEFLSKIICMHVN